MTKSEWISVIGILFALTGAGVSYGVASSQLADAREEIRLLREDMRAINAHFIAYVQNHRD